MLSNVIAIESRKNLVFEKNVHRSNSKSLSIQSDISLTEISTIKVTKNK